MVIAIRVANNEEAVAAVFVAAVSEELLVVVVAVSEELLVVTSHGLLKCNR